MIISFILSGSFVIQIENFRYVVDNPLDRKMTLSVPVLVVNFSVKREIVFEPLALKKQVLRNEMVSGDKLSHSYICYQWELDDGTFEPCNQYVNEQLEREYVKFVASAKSAFKRVLIQNVTRYNDDRKQDYVYDFEKMVQINRNTSYERRLKRADLSLVAKLNYTWEFEDNGWRRFDVIWQTQLEQNFINYTSGKQSHSIRIRCAPKPDIYEVNFFNMTETNLTSATMRNIRRI